MMTTLHFGATAVPWTVSWSAEEKLFLSHEPYFNAVAMADRALSNLSATEFVQPQKSGGTD
jgi:hypothetical protein